MNIIWCSARILCTLVQNPLHLMQMGKEAIANSSYLQGHSKPITMSLGQVRSSNRQYPTCYLVHSKQLLGTIQIIYSYNLICHKGIFLAPSPLCLCVFFTQYCNFKKYKQGWKVWAYCWPIHMLQKKGKKCGENQRQRPRDKAYKCACIDRLSKL